MAKKGKKRDRVKYENLIISRIFLVKQKAFLVIFFILIAKIKIVDTRFNYHNKISYIKNLMHTYFLPEMHYPNMSH